MAMAFALVGVVALVLGVLGVLRQRGARPLAKRAAVAPASLAEPLCGPPSIWHAGVLHAVDAAAFAALCEAMFRQDGCGAAPASIAGADLMLTRRDDPPRLRVVRCQAGSTAPVNEAALRALAAVIAEAHADAGIFIAACAIDGAAMAFARQHAITLVDGPALLKLIVQRSARQQRALREIARPSRVDTPPARFALEPTPAPAWFAAAFAGFVAAWLAWPAPRDLAPLQAAYNAQAPMSIAPLPRDRAEPEPHRPPRATPATAADLDPAPITTASPAAGRQVLRCTDAGRVSYLAADATCPQGQGERITVFPTEGVNPFR